MTKNRGKRVCGTAGIKRQATRRPRGSTRARCQEKQGKTQAHAGRYSAGRATQEKARLDRDPTTVKDATGMAPRPTRQPASRGKTEAAWDSGGRFAAPPALVRLEAQRPHADARPQATANGRASRGCGRGPQAAIMNGRPRRSGRRGAFTGVRGWWTASKAGLGLYQCIITYVYGLPPELQVSLGKCSICSTRLRLAHVTSRSSHHARLLCYQGAPPSLALSCSFLAPLCRSPIALLCWSLRCPLAVSLFLFAIPPCISSVPSVIFSVITARLSRARTGRHRVDVGWPLGGLWVVASAVHCFTAPQPPPGNVTVGSPCPPFRPPPA